MKNSTLINACEIKTGKLDSNQAVKDGQYPFFTCSSLPEKIDHYAFDDDVVLIAGNNAQGNFHVSRYKGKFNAYQRTYILTAKPEYDIDFVYYSLKLELVRLKDKSQGSQTKFLTMPILNNIVLNDISKFDQQQIASILSSLDSKIELNNRINAELEAMAKTLYDYWFVQFDFPVYNTDGTLSGVEGYKSSGGKMVWNEELKRDVPEGWTKGTLLDLGDIIGGSTPPREVQEYFTNNGTAWITPKDLSLNTGNKFISKGELDVTENGIKAASLNIMPKGTILLSSRAPIGYLAISREEVTTNQGFKSFVPNKGFSKEYVYYSVKNMIPTIENNAAGSTFKEVSATTLKSISICLADKAIVNKYTETVSSIFNRQDILEKENQQLSTLRDWLLPMLMNGQVNTSAALSAGTSTVLSAGTSAALSAGVSDTLGAKEYKLSSDEAMLAAEPEM